MGEASRRKKQDREVKDPLRWLRADVEAKEKRTKLLANAYHQVRAAYEESLAKLEASAAKLKENGHPLYQDAPETGSAPEAQKASEVPPYNDEPKPVADEDVVHREEMGRGEAE